MVLEVLARTTSSLTAPEVYRLAGTGSTNGVRLALNRLAHQGLVGAERRANTVFYLANRDHLAWPAVEALTSLRRTLINRMVEEMTAWEVRPVHASLFGSAARGDGDADSDIDLLLVRPDRVDEEAPPWAEQVDRLRGLVSAWTGNHCHVFELDRARLAEHLRTRDPIVDEWRRDAVKIAGDELRQVLRRLPRTGGRK
ncbi:nucleotidyltransferase domain-containing protein [Natronosporangium hydrolyticum]|uniref:Nucleotidyltransferase domain-containing protein n=1 Tax=Natronosporangium hydrolyticum TaxID=2811111 RepID=A0A895YAC2_9ACTN|nr:nucleotidyltransferase domain-containing protein [Natronosporangium hydrolyticum]QSB14724.1 nucleotidyltransferase domain-containing protein [Natronosporangium hydrolyticum]